MDAQSIGYDDLITKWKADRSLMERTFSNEHLNELASKVDRWESLAKHLKIPAVESDKFTTPDNIEIQRIRMLTRWKERSGKGATYEAVVKALIQAKQTELAQAIMKEVRDQSEQFQIANLQQLEEEFFALVNYIEVSIQKSKDSFDKIIRRFQTLPQSIASQHQTDKNYSIIRQRILQSKTTKELFDNLTQLKHWNFMVPDTLNYILRDVKNDVVHQKIAEYISKLKAFKETTKLCNIVGLCVPIPDYCMELVTMVDEWEKKTIHDAEKAAISSKTRKHELSHRPWNRTPDYRANHGRDVLLIASDESVTHFEADMRRKGSLTKDDLLKLRNQGISDCTDELTIVKERCKLDKNFSIVDIKSGGSLSREEILLNIVHHLSTTRNEGGNYHYTKILLTCSCVHYRGSVCEKLLSASA